MKIPRRDLLFVIGHRMSLLSRYQAADAWKLLSTQIKDMEQTDLPKFRHLTRAIRIATIKSRQ